MGTHHRLSTGDIWTLTGPAVTESMVEVSYSAGGLTVGIYSDASVNVTTKLGVELDLWQDGSTL